MKAYRSVLAVAFITAPLLPANAQAQGVSVQGVGNTSCGEYQQLRAGQSPAQDGVIVSWVWGYLSGFNMEAVRPTTAPLPDAPSTLAYIDKYCREAPLESVMRASMAMTAELGGKRRAR